LIVLRRAAPCVDAGFVPRTVTVLFSLRDSAASPSSDITTRGQAQGDDLGGMGEFVDLLHPIASSPTL